MEHVARMGKGEVNSELWCRNLRERYQLKDLGIAMRQAGSGWKFLIPLAGCQQTCMTYTIAVCVQ